MLERLEEVLTAEWNQIPQDEYASLTRSMPDQSNTSY